MEKCSLWFAIEDPEVDDPSDWTIFQLDEVPTNANINALKKYIHLDQKPIFNHVAYSNLSIFPSIQKAQQNRVVALGNLPFNPRKTIGELLASNDAKNETLWVVRAPPKPDGRQISAMKHVVYKKSQAYVSSRKYLTSVAVGIQKKFPMIQQLDDKMITIGDVFYSKKFNAAAVEANLPNFLKQRQWDFLWKLNDQVNGHLHSELEENALYQKQVIVPEEICVIIDYEDLLKSIAEKSEVVTKGEYLIIGSASSISSGSQ